MKNSILVLLLVVCSSKLIAQSEQAEIEKDYAVFWGLTVEKDLWGTMDYMYPRVFELAPKKKMVEAMRKIYEDTTLVLNYSIGQLENISDILEEEGVKYALVRYSYTMTMRLNDTEMDQEFQEMLLENYASMYGKENVKYDAEDRRYDIDVNAKMYAVKAVNYDTWKFIEKKDNYTVFFKDWFPKKVLKKLK